MARRAIAVLPVSALDKAYCAHVHSGSRPVGYHGLACTRELSPPTTRPKTVCFPSRWRADLNRMKNWDALVCLPLLAILRTPLALCWALLCSSSLNVGP